jgi:hypothetical protein
MEGQVRAWAARRPSCEAVLAVVFPRASTGGSLSNKKKVIGDLVAQMPLLRFGSVECIGQGLRKLSMAHNMGDPEVSGRRLKIAILIANNHGKFGNSTTDWI